jgi:DNA polymerase-3 subunit epsilon
MTTLRRQIILDTETTGLEPKAGHRIIEIGCVELVNRRFTGNDFHVYLNPEREIEFEAARVHGLTNEFLKDKPVFADVVTDFVRYIENAELIIHNAAFDVGFLNHELKLLRHGKIEACCTVVDTLQMARILHPGQRNSLDALCKRYNIDNSNRQLHGGLLDAQLLADVYLAMTSSQETLFATTVNKPESQSFAKEIHNNTKTYQLKVVQATAEELAAHEERLAAIKKVSGKVLWEI